MSFFDRAERERVIDKRMAEVKAAAQKRRAEETDQTGAFSEEYPEEGGVGKALPEDYKTSQTEFNPNDFTFKTDPSLQSDKDEEFDPNAVSFNTDPSLQSDQDEEFNPDDFSFNTDASLQSDRDEASAQDQYRNLAGPAAIFRYVRGEGTLTDAASGVGESVLAAAEDAGQAAVAAREASQTSEGQRISRAAGRLGLWSSTPIGRFLGAVGTAMGVGEAVGGAIREHRKGKAEEAYGGAAQTAEAAEASEEAEKGTASAYAYSHDDGTPIGALSQKSESGADGKPLKLSSTGLGGIDAISFGRGDPGGKSYGRHQFMTRMIKGKDGKLTRTGRYNPADSTMASFLQSKEAKPFSKEILASITDANGKVNWDLLGSDKFDAAWTKVTTGKGRAAWGAAQSNYLGRTHLKPNIDYLNTKYKDNEDIALLLTNKGFLEAIYSGGIQYGATGARKRLILPALLQAEKDNKLGDVAHVIELLYARRKSTGHARPTEKKQVLEMAKS